MSFYLMTITKQVTVHFPFAVDFERVRQHTLNKCEFTFCTQPLC